MYSITKLPNCSPNVKITALAADNLVEHFYRIMFCVQPLDNPCERNPDEYPSFAKRF